jgi:ADP-ribose pyrophosphatase
MSQTLFEGPIFRVERFEIELPNGKTVVRDAVRHPGAVVILPLLDDGRILLIRNFREVVRKWLHEIPAGTLEPGEHPDDAAPRELEEETGHRAGRLAKLTEFLATPGMCDERMYAYLAEGLEPTAQNLDEGECIDVVPTPLDEALEMVRDGRIEDAKTIATLLYYDRFVRERR